MKRFLIASIFFLPVVINAQSFWNSVVDDRWSNISHITDKGIFRDSLILVSGFVSDASCHNHQMFAYKLSGELQWTAGGYHDLILADSDYIYTAGFTTVDDVMGYVQIVVQKYDRSGNKVFSTGYPGIPHEEYYEFEAGSMDLAADGTILVSSGSSIVKSNSSGSSIKEYYVVLESPILSIHSINPVSYLIHTQNKIYKTDSAFTVTDSLDLSNTIHSLLVKDDTLVSLTGSYVIRIDSSLEIIDTIFVCSSEECSLEYYGDKLWLQQLRSDSLVLIHPEQGEDPDSLVFPSFMNNNEFIVSGNNIIFVGNSFTNQIGMCSFIVQEAEVSSTLLPDIELVDFTISDIVISYEQWMEDSVATGYEFNTELTVKNNGEEIIHSFAVYSDLSGGFNCAQNFFYQKFTDLDILPGQSQILDLNRVYEEGVGSSTLCFQCMAPNAGLEIQSGDNELCKTFNITGIKEEWQSDLKIYPNPFSDFLLIEQPDLNEQTIEIVDMHGKVLISRIAAGGRTLLETAALTEGVYIIKIQAGDTIQTQMLIKE